MSNKVIDYSWLINDLVAFYPDPNAERIEVIFPKGHPFLSFWPVITIDGIKYKGKKMRKVKSK